MSKQDPTAMEIKWFAAVDAAEMAAGNPLIALLGPRQMCDVLAFRARLKEGNLRLTCDHATSSYGIPVVVDASGNAYGPGEWISLAAEVASSVTYDDTGQHEQIITDFADGSHNSLISDLEAV